MVIPANVAVVYLEDVESIPVRKEDHSPAFEATRAEALMLAAAGCVVGHGSETKLRYLRLLCSPQEAEKMAVTEAERLSSCRKTRKEARLAALDALQRMARARKFIFREPLSDEDGKRSGRWVFAHKRIVIAA